MHTIAIAVALILLGQLGQIVEGPQVKRGDSSSYVRRADGTIAGGPASCPALATISAIPRRQAAP